MIEVKENLSISDQEIEIQVSTSGGPGGQNVNRVRTRVTVLFDVTASPSLSDQQRGRILEQLSTRINKLGVLRVASERHRTQQMNRNAAEQRLGELIAAALRERTPRRPTRPSARARKRRLEDKRRKSILKRTRGALGMED